MEEQTEPLAAVAEKPRCKNCDSKLSKRGKFCPNCGQRDFDGRVRMRDLLAKFFSNFTHLDSKFVQMVWHLLIPARVSLNYFSGKIKRYPHPVQFFFIVMFFFLLLFSKQFDESNLKSTGGDFSLQINSRDSIEGLDISKLQREKGLFGLLEQSVTNQKYRDALETLPPEYRTPVTRQALDSVIEKVSGPWERAAKKILDLDKSINHPNDSTGLDSISFNLFFKSVRIAVPDVVQLSPDSIISKYGITAWDEKITVPQGIKSLKEPRSLINRYVGSFGWAILVLISLMALVLRLLYWKRGGYYVEHFIFLMHQQAGAFLLLTIAFALQEYVVKLKWVWLLIFAWIGISLLIAMKRFYKENWAWTIAKWLLYCAIYVGGLLVLFVLTMLVVFVLF